MLYTPHRRPSKNAGSDPLRLRRHEIQDEVDGVTKMCRKNNTFKKWKCDFDREYQTTVMLLACPDNFVKFTQFRVLGHRDETNIKPHFDLYANVNINCMLALRLFLIL